MECPFCGSRKVESGELTSLYGLTFKANSSRFLFSKESPVLAEVCLNCGRLFDFKIKNLEKFNK
ncbi:hypothetical protein JCM1393_19730 [Clostridium carnis]